ncbi:hypothetical protein [Parafrankia soli]|uniref:hypothetical protein n=1 Tax=Parafrankia soli TaxID=2599596 RepID=UPI0034D75F13
MLGGEEPDLPVRPRSQKITVARRQTPRPLTSSRSDHRYDGLCPEVGYGVLVGLHLSQVAEADEPLTNDPLALLIDMVLDHAGFGKNE